MLEVDSSRHWRRGRRFAAKSVLVLWVVAVLFGCDWTGRQSDEHELPDYTATQLLAFDALCVGTRFDSGAFHASVSLFGDAADRGTCKFAEFAINPP